MAKRSLPCPTVLRQLLRYEPDTGKLFWREAPHGVFSAGKYPAARICKTWNGQNAGREALCYRDTPDSYAYGAVFGVKCYAHRALVALRDGAWPVCVDHQDGDRTNNSLGNLRACTRSQNAMNLPIRSQNTSGRIGVCWDKTRGKWAAEIKSCGVRRRLGRFDSFDDACAARAEAEKDMGFHPNHGRD